MSMTASLWKVYSIPLQADIVFRYVQEEIGAFVQLCDAEKQDMALIKKASQSVAEALSFQLPL